MMDEIERIRDYYSPTPGVSEGITIQHVRTLLAALDAEKVRYREAYADYHAAMDALDAEKARVKELEKQRDAARRLLDRIDIVKTKDGSWSEATADGWCELDDHPEAELTQLRSSIAALADKHEEAERSYEFGDDDPEHFSWHLTMAGELRALLEKP